MQILGVFTDIYGSTSNMNMGQTLLISLLGFSIVFMVLGFLAIFVFLMGKFFDALNRKKEKKALQAPEITETEEIRGNPLPDGCSAGELVLRDVSEEQAAVIMAIVSYKSGIPLNRLKFNSIKLMEEENK